MLLDNLGSCLTHPPHNMAGSYPWGGGGAGVKDFVIMTFLPLYGLKCIISAAAANPLSPSPNMDNCKHVLVEMHHLLSNKMIATTTPSLFLQGVLYFQFQITRFFVYLKLHNYAYLPTIVSLLVPSLIKSRI